MIFSRQERTIQMGRYNEHHEGGISVNFQKLTKENHMGHNEGLNGINTDSRTLFHRPRGLVKQDRCEQEAKSRTASLLKPLSREEISYK